MIFDIHNPLHLLRLTNGRAQDQKGLASAVKRLRVGNMGGLSSIWEGPLGFGRDSGRAGRSVRFLTRARHLPITQVSKVAPSFIRVPRRTFADLTRFPYRAHRFPRLPERHRRCKTITESKG